MKHRTIWVVPAVAAAVLAACGGRAAPTAADAAVASSVSIKGFTYQPNPLSVRKGTTITWTNNDPTIHTISAEDNSFDSGTFKQDATFRITTTKAGSYPYFCRTHPFMRGTLTVTE